MSVAPVLAEEANASILPRPGITAFARSDGGVVLDDASTGNHYRLGPSEYRFFTHLSHTGNPVAAHNAVLSVDSEWTPDNSKQLLAWLYQRRLIETDDGNSDVNAQHKSGVTKQTDLLFLRVSFGTADPLVRRLTEPLKSLLVRHTGWIAVLLVSVACVGLMANWTSFSAAYANLISPSGGIALAIAAIGLKIVHELGHCVACQVYGGRVRQCGVMFICGAPLPFVDVSESRRFPSRSARIHVALAGVAVECVATSIAVLVALSLDSASAYFVAAHLVLSFGVASIVFNLNPLMKFDGYYALSELLKTDNLYQRGGSYVHKLLSQLFLGRTSTASQPVSPLVKYYGIASFIWRMLTFAAIGGYVIWALEWLGLILVGWTMWRSFGGPMRRTYRQQQPDVGHNTATCAAVGLLRPAIVCGALASLVFLLPLPANTVSHAVVEYDPPAVIRSPTAAFVKKVHVADNQHVEAGELLLTLGNDSLFESHAELEAKCRRLQLLIRAARSRQNMRELKQAETDFAAAKEQLHHASVAVEALEVRAPTTGIVSAKDLSNLLGSYFAEGDEIAAVGQDESKRLRLLVDPKLMENFSRGDAVRFLSPTGYAGSAEVDSILPRLTRSASSSSLGAHLGGPLDVVNDESGEINFSTPQISIIASLNREQSKQIHVGQRVAVSTGNGRRLYEWLRDQVWPEG